ncbi:FeoB-associated Cys-rich membrane protein [Hymenobacter sp. BRD128]|uniref:FeoB-associated Cys-rich membrane protein n=1 Tax=Hymenobacter sp. BRD128 TaxID=2675878 RepID=UPI001563E79E|nr:FeoB-associated Cys-rich membrane protein [Hymenobacter sp. BRD128]QKG57885.1 FeoB-associated Cys-rich membrane protein [Hymenobacter sp. BRD128]
MDVQLLIILALFAAALFYMGRRLWLAFAAKGQAGCAKGCGGACGAALDVEALQRTIEARSVAR